MAAREPQADLWDGKEVVGLFKYRMRVFYRHPPKNVKKRNWYANNIRGHSQEMAVVPLGPYICNARGDFFFFEHLPWGWAFIRSSSRMDSLPSSLPPNAFPEASRFGGKWNSFSSGASLLMTQHWETEPDFRAPWPLEGDNQEACIRPLDCSPGRKPGQSKG